MCEPCATECMRKNFEKLLAEHQEVTRKLDLERSKTQEWKSYADAAYTEIDRLKKDLSLCVEARDLWKKSCREYERERKDALFQIEAYKKSLEKIRDGGHAPYCDMGERCGCAVAMAKKALEDSVQREEASGEKCANCGRGPEAHQYPKG